MERKISNEKVSFEICIQFYSGSFFSFFNLFCSFKTILNTIRIPLRWNANYNVCLDCCVSLIFTINDSIRVDLIGIAEFSSSSSEKQQHYYYFCHEWCPIHKCQPFPPLWILRFSLHSNSTVSKVFTVRCVLNSEHLISFRFEYELL